MEEKIVTDSKNVSHENQEQPTVAAVNRKKWLENLRNDWTEHRYDILSLAVGIANIAITTIFIFVAIVQNKQAIAANEIAERAAISSDSTYSLLLKQWQLQKAPFMNIRNFTIDFNRGKMARVALTLENLGQYPIRLRHSYVYIAGRAHDTIPDANKILQGNMPKDWIYRNAYITKESSPTIYSEIEVKSPNNSREVIYDQYKSGLRRFYLIGEIVYINEADDSEWRYFFNWKITSPTNCLTGCEFEPIENDNQLIKK